MKGIVLMSHGDMAKGMAQSATMFFGDNIEQFTYCCLKPENSPEDFALSLQEAIKQVDSGEGVILLADLFGGTPCNQAIFQLNENVELIAGMSFPLLMELLGQRLSDEVDVNSLIEKGQTSLVNVKKILEANSVDDDED